MSLIHTDEQLTLQTTIRQFVTSRTPMAQVREVIAGDTGFDPGTWHQIANQLGLAGLAIPDNQGGVGGTTGDLCVALRELGSGLVPSPMIASTVLTAGALLALDDQAARDRWLPGLAAGEIVGALAVSEPGESDWLPSTLQVTARSDSDGVSITGTKSVVLNGCEADVLLVLALREGRAGFYAVAADSIGVRMTRNETLDLTRSSATIDFTNAAATEIVGDAFACVESLIDLANLAMSAQQLGAMQSCVDMATEYAKMRHSFGQPIGSNQAVKHRLADMYVDLALADAALRDACGARDRQEPDASARATATRVLTSRAYVSAARHTMLLHGGIGFTWEHDAHLFYRNALSDSALLGGPEFQLQRLATLIEV